ncbi:MAG: UDP-glucose 4-epimerase GalE [Microcoleus sp.]
MKLLIIGGAGYIGGVTTHLAHDAGHQVTVADNLSSGHRENIPDGVTFIEGDIREKAFVDRLFADTTYDVIIHFAAKILVAESMEQPYEYYQNNTVATLEIVDAAVKAGCKNYIISSTAATYGEPTHTPVSESDPTLPVNPYGFSKLMSEQLLRSYELTHGLHWCALRYFNVAGAYDGVGPAYPFIAHIIPMLLDNLEKNQPITINGTDYDTPDGSCIRDYVHVHDIARAHLLAADVLLNETINQPINLGSSNGYSVKQVIETFQQVTGKRLDVVTGPRRPGDPAQLIASNQRAKELLSWEPTHSLEDIIRDHYDWYVSKL